MSSYIYLAIAFIFNATANVLLKLGSDKGLFWDWRDPVVFLKSNLLFIAGIALFGINVIFYFLALKDIPISVAYPVMVVMSFVLINVSAIWFMNEKINIWQWLGYVLIIAGLALVYAFAAKK